MIIIQLAGGLGNQMFQHALYLQLKSLGKDVRIDDVTGFVQDSQRDPALRTFGISYECASRKELVQMLDSSLMPWSRVRRKLFGRKRKAYFEEDKRYHPEIMTWDDIYLEGYWQTEKYFSSVSDEVRQVYDTDRLLEYIRNNRMPDSTVESAARSVGVNYGQASETIEEYLTRISSTESVGVHIRRGDYLLPENQVLFGGICTEAYYKEAMEQMKREYPNCRFYVFTNDKKWVSQQIANTTGIKNEDAGFIKDIEVVDLKQQSDYAEFALMSKCKHQVLANSSFSWWASYLNRNTDKTVLAPDRWLNGWDSEDFYRSDMRRVTATKGTGNT